ncbi:MAG TPA: hypothetical protein VGM25_15675 [Caulobacteraceae bacterium]|jgi:hypothetical protein
MLKTMSAAVLAACALAAAGHGAGVAKTAPARAPAPAKPAPMVTVNDSMTHVMSLEAQTIWDVSSKAFNFQGDGLNPKKLDAKDWKALEGAGIRIRERAMLLATAKRVIVAGPDEHILGEEAAHAGVKKTWDAASARQVQALIDAQPKKFAEHAWTLVRTGDSLAKAAKLRDIKTVYKVSAGLDEVCDGCHQPFWGTDDPPPPPKNKAIPLLVGR